MIQAATDGQPKKPALALTIAGEPLNIGEYFISLTLRDHSGFTADQLDLVLNDKDNKLALPRRGVRIGLQLGYSGQLIDKHFYIVDEVEHSNHPRRLTIRARSADFRSSLKVPKTRSWHRKTLGDIISTIAAEHQLTPAISTHLQATHIAHIDQTNESDLNLITRLGQQYGANPSLKNGHLLFIPQYSGQNTSGQQLPTATLYYHQGDRHTYREADRSQRYTGVQAKYRDRQAAKTRTVLAGSEGYTHTLKQSFPDQPSAQAAAAAKWRDIQAAQKTLSLTLAEGDPYLVAGQPGKVVGIKPEIDAEPWVIDTLTQQLDDNGLTSQVDLLGLVDY